MSVLFENNLNVKYLETTLQKSGFHILFTKQKELVRQFLTLRNNIMFDELHIKNDEKLSFFDDEADFLLVLNSQEQVIAGCKFLYSNIVNGISDNILSQEIANTDFLYYKFLNTIDQRQNLTIAESSNIMIAKNYRFYSEIILQNCSIEIIKLLKHKVNYCLWVTEIVRSRVYRKILKSIGTDAHISLLYLWQKDNQYPSRIKNSICQNYVSYIKFF